MALFKKPTLSMDQIGTLDFRAERHLFGQGVAHVAGCDEVGRGCLAGPVVAAAVVLDPSRIPEGLRDSKKISASKREVLSKEICTTALAVGLGAASVAEIDRINILNASLEAMVRAVKALTVKPDHVLVDGNRAPKWGFDTSLIIKGDDRVLSIAAASIIAKVMRDRYMARLHKKFPAYGWQQNAGYGVKAHQEALQLVGVTPHHRKSFKPIANLLSRERSINI